MTKIKIVKKLPTSKKKHKRKVSFTTPAKPSNKFTDKYLEFYDDIKIPSKRYDW